MLSRVTPQTVGNHLRRLHDSHLYSFHGDCVRHDPYFRALFLLLAISDILASTLSIMSSEYRPDCSACSRTDKMHTITITVLSALCIPTFQDSEVVENLPP